MKNEVSDFLFLKFIMGNIRCFTDFLGDNSMVKVDRVVEIYLALFLLEK